MSCSPGPGRSLVRTISCLEAIQMEEEAAELRSRCSRGWRRPLSWLMLDSVLVLVLTLCLLSGLP